MLRFLTAGESHGRALVGILEGMPYGLALRSSDIDEELSRRQKGYGRGGRMKIEKDTVQILAGVRDGITLGSPIALLIENKDWKNWESKMAVDEISGAEPVRLPRPGHADLPGSIKYRTSDVRNILERASARETAMRVALGAIARKFLKEFGMEIGSHVVAIGNQTSSVSGLTYAEIQRLADESSVRCVDAEAEGKMIEEIRAAAQEGDTLGGVFEVFVTGVPVGLGSHVHWDRRLDADVARALMGIQAIKGVEVGLGFDAAYTRGSSVHDAIYHDGEKYVRKTNNAGGIEGGITNGEVLIFRAAMKPIPTLTRSLDSVDIVTKEAGDAAKERSDVCAVPAASIVAEAVVALEIAKFLIAKLGGDSMEEMLERYNEYMKYIERVQLP